MVRQRALLLRVCVVAVARDEDVRLALARLRAVGVAAVDDERVQRMELGSLAGDLSFGREVAAVPDPRTPDRHPVAVGGPREERQRPALPLVMEPLVLLVVGEGPTREVAGLRARAPAEQVAVLLVEREVRAEVVEAVLAGGVILGPVRDVAHPACGPNGP